MALRSVPDNMQLGAAQRQWRTALCLLFPLGIGAAPAILSLGDLPLCAFKHLSGVPCPLCGGIRACAALAQGDLYAAFLFNPGLFPLLVVAAVHSGLLLLEAVSGCHIDPAHALASAWKLAGGILMLSWLARVLGQA